MTMNKQRLGLIGLTMTAMLFMVAPVFANGSPSISIGAPTCPAAPAGEYVSYIAATKKCVYGLLSDPTKIVDTKDPSQGVNANLPGLGNISLPTFLSLNNIQNFSIWSYASLIGTLVFIALILFWVFLLIRAGVKVIQSEGDPAALVEAQKRFTSVVMGVIFLVGFFVVINIVAAFLGIGNFTEWPKVFSQCKDGTYYYNKKLSGGYTNSDCVDSACFSGSSSLGCHT